MTNFKQNLNNKTAYFKLPQRTMIITNNKLIKKMNKLFS